jgi:hypothetical protein
VVTVIVPASEDSLVLDIQQDRFYYSGVNYQAIEVIYVKDIQSIEHYNFDITADDNINSL